MDASTIILGFTGSLGSGCSYISEMLPKISPNNYKYYKLSDVIRDIFKDEGKLNPNIKELQDKGNDLRRKNENGFLVGELLNKIDQQAIEPFGIIIDGIKNEGEIQTLRQFPFFYLISVHSDRDKRCRRCIEEGSFSSKNDFHEADDRDEQEEFEYGQQVKKCNYLSDIIILNDIDIPQAAEQQREEFVRKIYNRYIKLIENLRDGIRSPEIFPTDDELLMTTAYSLSKKSSCLKRKVGAVIVEMQRYNFSNKESLGKVDSLPFILSTGYNEVPIGSYKCIFHPEFEKCYRDYLKETYAQKLKYCPNCGYELKLNLICKKCNKDYDKYVVSCEYCHDEIETKYVCSNCNNDVFEEFIPGSKKFPGKLLDMCRSLYAEEIAILKLQKAPELSKRELILYSTTQPCNLCANKIVLAGIKEVVFSEPYLMKEAAEILESGGVKIRRFEGIKSTAFFKLYQ